MEQISTVEFQKKITDKGYIRIFVDDNWIYEHVYIVQQFIGRELLEGEVIHHIDGNKKNNRVSNLYLFKSQKEHKSFENKVMQFGWTRPLIRKVNLRWEEFNKDGIER